MQFSDLRTSLFTHAAVKTPNSPFPATNPQAPGVPLSEARDGTSNKVISINSPRPRVSVKTPVVHPRFRDEVKELFRQEPVTFPHILDATARADTPILSRVERLGEEKRHPKSFPRLIASASTAVFLIYRDNWMFPGICSGTSPGRCGLLEYCVVFAYTFVI